MKRVNILDDTFLRFESRRKPFHVGTVMLFEPQDKASHVFVSQLAQRLRAETHAVAPFNRRLIVRYGLHYWKTSDDIDLSHHFMHLALPKPSNIRELLTLVSQIHSGHLDRAYPLWQFYLIEGLEDGRFAVYLKVHHALVDGITGIRLLVNSMSEDRKRSLTLPPVWAIPSHKKTANKALPVQARARSNLAAIRSLAKGHLKSLAPAVREFRSNISDLWHKNPNFVIAGQAPRCVMNQKVSTSRRFAAQSYKTARLKAVADAFGTGLNDVVLAMCGGAMRHYLQERNELPDSPLVAAVPVSIRREDSESGNEVAFTFTHLATHYENPGARLKAIKACMDYNKEHLKKLSPDQILVFSAMKLIPGTISDWLGNSPDKVLGNLVISHVPGPQQTLYWQGARLCGLYPLSVLNDGSGLNITIISRHDYVDFGLIACPISVPHMQHLLLHLESALQELEAVASVSRKNPERCMQAH